LGEKFDEINKYYEFYKKQHEDVLNYLARNEQLIKTAQIEMKKKVECVSKDLEAKIKRIVALETNTTCLQRDLDHFRAHKKAELEKFQNDIHSLKEGSTKHEKTIQTIFMKIDTISRRQDHDKKEIATTLEEMQEPIRAEITRMRRENEALMQELDRNQKMYRELLVDFTSMLEDKNGADTFMTQTQQPNKNEFTRKSMTSIQGSMLSTKSPVPHSRGILTSEGTRPHLMATQQQRPKTTSMSINEERSGGYRKYSRRRTELSKSIVVSKAMSTSLMTNALATAADTEREKNRMMTIGQPESSKQNLMDYMNKMNSTNNMNKSLSISQTLSPNSSSPISTLTPKIMAFKNTHTSFKNTSNESSPLDNSSTFLRGSLRAESADSTKGLALYRFKHLMKKIGGPQFDEKATDRTDANTVIIESVDIDASRGK